MKRFQLTAGWTVLAVIAGTLGLDVHLVRMRRESVSTWADKHFPWVAAGFVLLLCHFRGQPRFMRRLDVFAATARWLRRNH